MNVSLDPQWDRLPHLFAGELSADETRELLAWIDATPDRRVAAARLREIWQLGASGPRAWDTEAGWAAVERRTIGERGRVVARVDGQAPPREIGLARRRWKVGLAAAAAAAVAITVGVSIVPGRFRSSFPVSSTPASTEYKTRTGERLSLRLSDGTLALLAPSSVLRVSPSYGRRGRAVMLDGEAEFVVTHDAARPFAVHTATAIARDLGTRFVVRGYAADSMTEVVVAEGVVTVGRSRSIDELETSAALTSDSVVLRPGARARVAATGAPRMTRTVALDPYFAWTNGRLVFDDTPLADVVRRLNRWYGVDIRLMGARTAQRRLIASFSNEPIADVLHRIAQSLNLDVRQADRTFTLRAR